MPYRQGVRCLVPAETPCSFGKYELHTEKDGQVLRGKNFRLMAVSFSVSACLVGCEYVNALGVPQKSPVPAVPAIAGVVSGLGSDVRASVEARSPTNSYATETANGPWRMGGLRDGVYVVEARAPGYTVMPISYTVTIANGKREDKSSLDFEFPPEH